MGVGRRPRDVLENERAHDRRPLSLRQRRKRLVENRVEEIAERGEAERGLALRRLRPQDEQRFTLRDLDARAPEGRLPHPRLTLENEH